MAELLTAGGARVYNEVVLNQVLVGFGDLASTDAIVDAVQRDGTCWLGATTWQGKRLIRVSVSNWTTTEADINISADAILRAAASVLAKQDGSFRSSSSRESAVARSVQTRRKDMTSRDHGLRVADR